jgi:proline iminopeptidase
MQVNRRGFLSSGAILPTTILAGAAAPQVSVAAGSDGNATDQRRSHGHRGDEHAGSCGPERAGYARVNGQKLYYVSLGRGTPVIFMHGGLGFDHQYFRPFVDPLAHSANVVYYDHLGHGRSDRPANFSDLTLARLSSDCDGLATALGFERFILVGHSYGGFIALDFALRFPDRLAGLVLSCTAADLASLVLRRPLGGTVAQQEALGRLFAGPAANATDAALRENWTTALPLYYNNVTPPVGVTAAVDRRTIYSAAGFNRGNEILGGYNLVGYLPSIEVPTAVHYGVGDIWRFGDDEKIAKNIPGATLKYFPNSGHWPFQEEQAAYIAHMRGFVATVESDDLRECHRRRLATSVLTQRLG